MILRAFSSAAIVILMLSPPTIANADDRTPTAEEREGIESSLRGAGYTSWEEIEFDDGLWEVDDARKGGENREFDLKLDPRTYDITVERDD